VDFEFFIKLAANSKITCQVNDDFVFYRVLSTSATSNYGTGENWRKERLLLKDNLLQYFKGLHVDEKAAGKLKLKIATWALINAFQNAKEGNAKDSFKNMKEAIKTNPLIVKNISTFARIFAHLVIKKFK
jgi:hypothetical protein